MKAVVMATFLVIATIIPIQNAYTVDGKTLYVGGNGPGNYTSIQDAINAAENGDTIFVYNGIYEESVYVNKEVNIIGESRERVIIEAWAYGYAFNISSNNVKIRNFNITNATWNSAAIVFFNCENCVVENCIIHQNGGDGISFINADKNEIKNCVIFDNLIGISMQNSNENEIKSCYIYKNGDGIDIEHGSKNEIMECNVSQNSWVGISINIAPENKIHDCKFSKNGILISGNLQDFVQQIDNNSIDGKPILYFYGKKIDLRGIDAGEIITVACDNFTIQNCSAGGGDAALEMAFCSDGLIKNCRFHNAYYGLLSYNSTRNIIEGNLITHGKENGIELKGSDKNVIRENEIYGWDMNAISLTESCNNSVYGNSIHNNGMGILIFSYSHYNNVSYNHVYENQFYGISVQGGSHNIIEKNVIEKSWQWCGVAIVKSWSKFNVVRENSITKNKYGIHLEGVGNKIERNNISSNEYGIYLSSWLSECKRNVISQNNFIENGKDAGFEVDFLSLNNWNGNYWDKWKIKAPKPIYGFVIIKIGRNFGLQFPWINFDFNPAMKPYN